MERFGSLRGAVLRSVEISYGPAFPAFPEAPWSARVVVAAREAEPEQEGEGGREAVVTFSVEDVKELRMSELTAESRGSEGGKKSEGEQAGAAPGTVLAEGIRIGFLGDLVYLDLRPRSEAAETLADFLDSGLVIAGARCTWEVVPRRADHVVDPTAPREDVTREDGPAAR